MSKYAVYDINDNDVIEFKTIEEAREHIGGMQDSIYEDGDGLIDLGEHIKLFKLVETVSFVEDIEETKEQKFQMGMWQTVESEE